MEIKEELIDSVIKEECIEENSALTQTSNQWDTIKVKEEVVEPLDKITKEECTEESDGMQLHFLPGVSEKSYDCGNVKVEEESDLRNIIIKEERAEENCEVADISDGSSKISSKRKDHNKEEQILSLNQKESLVCSNCAYANNSDRVLRKRRALNHGELQVECTKCSFSEKTTSEFESVNRTKLDIRFSCPECERRFKSNIGLMRHLKSVHVKNFKIQATNTSDLIQIHMEAERVKHTNCLVKCNLCDYSAKRKPSLINHIRAYHENIRYTCDECQKMFKRKDWLVRHIKSVHWKMYCFSCSKCNFSTTRKSSLKMHTQAIHDKVQSQCDLCDFTASKGGVIYHKKKVHMKVLSNIRHNCHFCNYSSKSTYNLKNHIKVYHDNIRFTCAECLKMFNRKDGLLRHIKSMHMKIRFPCSECYFTAVSQDSLTKHSLAAHNEVKFQSEYSGSKESLVNHEMTVRNMTVIRYSCHLCDYGTDRKACLIAHTLAYHEKIKYTCAQCLKNFKKKDLLRRHVNSVHMKTEIYSCSKCQYTTTRTCHLKSHTLSVHDRIKFQCDSCAFRGSKESLTFHKRKMHSEIQSLRHNCHLCDYSTDRKSRLMDHTRVFHENIKYTCPECTCTFNYRDGLKRHIKTHKMICSS